MDLLTNDSCVAAVNKPCGLATIPGRGEKTSVFEELAALLGLPHTGTVDPRLRVVHRLDKDTSGVLLFAKTIEAQRLISHQFQNNTTRKEYLAIVVGRPDADQGTIDAALAPHPTSRDRMLVSKHGRPALTEWKVEDAFRGYSLLRVFPRTGKTHQIRVHLKHIGLPLAVDALYNPHGPPLLLSSFKRRYRPARDEDERPLIARLTLHAEKLSLTHPSGEPLALEAPMPKDFRAALNMLRKYARA